MIFNAFRNNSGFSDFHLRNASEVAPAAPEHFRFLSQKIPKSFQNDSGILQELSGMCRNQFDLMVYPKQLFGIIETYPMTSLCETFLLSETFRCPKLFGDFLSNCLSSIQQLDDP